MVAPELNTHHYKMEAGKHRGQLITRVPAGYLLWMVRNDHSEKTYAEAELARRGTTTPRIEVSGHAIDRASLSCRKIWLATRRDDNEGIHAWLCRVAFEAWEAAIRDGWTPTEGDKVKYEGMKFVFDRDGAWPIVKTVMRDKGGKHDATAAEEVNCGS